MTYLKILVITLALYISRNFLINLSNLELSVNFLGLPLKYAWSIDVCSAYLNVTTMECSKEYYWSFGPEGPFPVVDKGDECHSKEQKHFCLCKRHWMPLKVSLWGK